MARLSVLLLASTLLSAGPTLAAQAQSAPAAPPAAAPAPQAAAPAAPSDGMQADMARQRDHDAFFEAHLAGLHAGLRLTPDQEAMWPPVEQAIRGYATMRTELGDRRSDMRQDARGSGEDANPIADLKTVSEDLLERGKALNALSTAAEPLYASLSEDQKHRLPMLLHDLVPRRGPVAEMVERLAGEGQPDRRMSGDGMDGRDDWHHRHGWEGRGRDGWRQGMNEGWWHHGDRRAEMAPDDQNDWPMHRHGGPDHDAGQQGDQND